jgi:NTP pyrophosphatase (non-canonical NTP hydrolase)
MLTVKELQKRYAEIAHKRGFDDAELKDYILLLVEEVGELCRAVTTSEGVKRIRPGEVNIGEELADIFNYSLYIAEVTDIDLQAEIIKKMDKLEYGKKSESGDKGGGSDDNA